MTLTLNWRYLWKLGVGLLVVAVGFFVVHRFQSKKQVNAYLTQADAARQEGDKKREALYLNRYLVVRPDDNDVRERLGRLMCANSKTGNNALEGYLVIEDVLRRDPTRDELRRYAVDTAISLGLYTEAKANLQILLDKRPKDGELERLFAMCFEAEGHYPEAVEWYEKAIEHKRDHVEAYAGLANVLRFRQRQSEAADKVMQRMMEANPTRYETHLTLANYWRLSGRLDQSASVIAPAVAGTQGLPPEARVEAGVIRAIAEAQKLAPDELNVVLLAADITRTRGRELLRQGKRKEADTAFAEARGLLAGVLEHPRHRSSPDGYLAMARLESEVGNPAAAVAVLQKALEEPSRSPNSVELTLALLDNHISVGNAAAAADVLDRLRDGGLSEIQGDYQRARILILSDEWIRATALLERVQQELSNEPGFARQVALLLGRCYEQSGENNRRLESFRRALPVDPADPLWVPAMTGLAEAQLALGQAEPALDTYRKLADLVPGAWVRVARLEMLRALKAPVVETRWNAVADALARAQRAVTNPADLPVEVPILEADLDFHRGDAAAARKRLESLQRERPKELAVWLALAVQDLREGDPVRAGSTLRAAEKNLGDSSELRLAKARLLVDSKNPELGPRLAELGEGAEKFGSTNQRQLLRGLAEIASAIGADETADKLWQQLSGATPFDLGVHITRFDRAARAGRRAEMESVLGDIRRVNGENGPSTRMAQAILYVWSAQHVNDTSKLDDAQTLLDGLERERAGSGRVALGQALIFDLKGNPDLALGKYRQAVELGERNLDALRRLMVLLSAKGRFVEAYEVFQKFPTEAARDPEVQRLAAELSLRTDHAGQALAFAARAVPENSTNPQDQIWIGQMYWVAGDRAKAEARFRAAIKLRPESMDGWLLLIRYFVATDHKDEAEQVLTEALQKVAPADRSLLRGLGYAQIGKVDLAAGAFHQASQERPDTLRVIQAEAEFLLQSGKLNEARAAFKRVLDLSSSTPEDKEFARWMIALCLAANRDYSTSREALTMLGLLENDTLRAPTGSETPSQRRSRAAVLALQRDRTSRLEAIRLLSSLGEATTPNDQFLLAQLHGSVGNGAQVRLIMSELLRKSDKVPLYLGFYAGWLLRAGELGEAETWIKKLEALHPSTLATAELKARLLAAQKNPDAARAAILSQAEVSNAPIGRIAQICEEIGLFPDAERLFARYVEQNRATRPQAVLTLAAYYGRRGRTADALQICDEARSRLPAPVWGEIAVAALYAARTPVSEDATKVAGWLEAAAAKPGATVGILLQLIASVRNLQGDYAAAIGLYRRALEADAKDVLAMNNLSYLLSTREGRHEDALNLIATARKIAGPTPDLLDTEALIRLNKGEAEAARKLLGEVVVTKPSASAYFHLARAESASKRDLEARVAWRRAIDLGLQAGDLHPLERPEFEQSLARFK